LTTTTGHRILWARGIRHRDISPSNLMFYFYVDSNGDEWVIGVLNDYDLSSMKDVPTGRERTGTVPFMALGLLTDKAMEGKVEHLYRHDAESFIWVLTWITLQYKDGKFQSNGPLNGWLKENATRCRDMRSGFLIMAHGPDGDEMKPSSSHQSNWKIALSCLRVFFKEIHDEMEDKDVFQNWLYAKVPSWCRE
jgi:hypothetical protein